MTAPRPLALDLTPALIEAAAKSKAWPFEEARKIVARLEKTGKGEVLFETGYGPSGLPHIGTFGEVARTTMVLHAFRVLTGDRVPTRLLCFSDDMDGMRKVPDNVPNQDLLRGHLGKPLTRVPDPFGTHDSFGHHNNARLRGFLDAFGFTYEFASATDYYAAGRLDEKLLVMLERYDDVMAIMLPTLREERRRTYAPFLPVHPKTGVVMQVPIEERNVARGTVVWTDPDTGERFETPVTGGGAKAQWKPDWALRWAALGVDYEMSGKDHIDNVRISGQICRVLGERPPEGFNYELFLDDQGQKISKSKGNGLTIDEWLSYASPESLSLFMFREPKAAKRLYFDVIPKNVDEYAQFLEAYRRQPLEQQLGNPVWHVHSGLPPEPERIGGAAGNAPSSSISFTMLLNLVSASNAEDRAVLWGFLSRYAPGASPASNPELDRLVGYAIRYFHDFVKPGKVFRAPTATERAALEALDAALGALPAVPDGDAIQAAVYDVGRSHFPDTKKLGPDGRPGVSQEFFASLYQVLIGQERGPRFGSFVALYGVAETRTLIGKALAGTLATKVA
ncbi:lysine--tRNA ligase [Prosthecomicrobium hirschii]|uniref:lysine--tRNA ligase n=1 Tax=Prosthecodimorpha hirschii TaxID=665126 RepID=UPI00112B1F65|nr:lysine--tRNA ligase [Prosthecomicrobium hirschii]TPQ49547.1 lysine--tRNA ligase [Prosthecomicrobium hirschii]